MDYEKKYKEALDRAKSMYESSDEAELAAYIFPELRESEDERIRKALIEGVRQIRCKGDVTQEQMLAYLEKQKEPHYTKRNALFNKCLENCDPKVMKEVSDKVDEILQKEQKPSCWNSPILTNEMIIDEKSAEWDKLQADFRSINEAFEDGKKEVVDNPKKYGLCRPAEWSEEDLEEAARHSEIISYPMPEEADIEKVMKVQEARIFHEIGFKAGAEWQKEQMMKDDDDR